MSRIAGILDEIAAFLQKEQAPNPQLAGRHPSDNADMSALQLAPHMAKGLINDVARYGKQAVTGQVSDTELLPQQPLTGNAKSIADAAGSAMGTALNYQVPSLLRGPRSAMDDINMVVDAYQGVRPGIVDAIGEPSVNRVEGAGLLGSMFIPAKVPKPKSGGLFSQAVIASDNLQRKTGNADGFFNDLTGKGQVKPDELNAMGFKEHFAGRSDVSRDEVRQFINDNQVQIKETVLGKPFEDRYVVRPDPDGGFNVYDASDPSNEVLNSYGRQETAASAAETMNGSKNVDTSKFGSYTLDGGDNYREILLQDNSATRSLQKPFINSSHFDEPNILAHLRMKDRVDTEGNKTLLIEEAQSDWHQAGGDRGYSNKGEYNDLMSEQRRLNVILNDTAEDAMYGWGRENLPELNQKITDLHKENRIARRTAQDFYAMNGGGINQPLALEVQRTRHAVKAAIAELNDAFNSDFLKRNGISAEDAHRQAQSEMQILRAELDPMHDAVPDAPFKTDDKSSWYNLALKRGLLEAVEGGYDKLALTTGRQQADRYDLSNQIGSMRLREEIIPNNKASGGDPLGSRKMFLLDAFDLDGNKVINRRIDNPEKELPNIIGKEVSKKLLNQEAGVLYPDVPSSTAKVKILNGLDLSVGGEGMKQFYDRTLPNALNKMVKQDGVKVSESNLIGKTPSKTEIASASDREELITLRDKIFNGDDTSPTHDRYNELLAKYQPKPRTDAVHSIDITPKMRERVKKGLPLFATGGAAIGLTEMMSQQQQEDQRSGLFNSLQY